MEQEPLNHRYPFEEQKYNLLLQVEDSHVSSKGQGLLT